ncbi:MAG: hypothetical protein K2W95_29095 [Candidatus Obscuribacterales bacterium]|nr:hypothetical protein [Candidatus Obscuribacterales bacterium]
MVFEVADEVGLRQFKSAIYVFPGVAALGTLPTVIATACDRSPLHAQLPLVCGALALPIAFWVGTYLFCTFLDRLVIRVHVSSAGLLIGTLAGNKAIARKNILKVQSIRFGAVPVYKVTTSQGKFDISGHKDDRGLLIKELRSLLRMSSDEHVYESSRIFPYVYSFLPLVMGFFILTASIWDSLKISDYSFTPVPGLVAWLLYCWFCAYSVCYRVHRKGDRFILSTLLRTIVLRSGDNVRFDPSWQTVKCDQGRFFIPSFMSDLDLCNQDLKKLAGIELPVACEACEEQPIIMLGSKIRPERKKLGWW